MSLLTALPAQSLRAEVLNSKAGELLAAPADTRSHDRYVFTICETEPGSVMLKGIPLNKGKQGDDLVQTILRGLVPDVAQRRGSL